MAKIAIDFGSSKCVVTVLKNRTPQIVSIEGSMTTPSVIWVNPNGEFVVGRRAKQHIAVDPNNIIINPKRDIGSSKTYQIGNESFTPTEAATIILAYLKHEASKSLFEEVNDAVITVPAFFGEKEKNAIQKAALDAGLTDIQIISESLAASYRYCIDSNRSQTFVLIDIGSSFTDVSVAYYENSKGQISINTLEKGSLLIGGDDFDNALIEWMIHNGAEGYSNKLELKAIAEAAKIELEVCDVTTIGHPIFMPQEVALTRDEYVSLIQDKLNDICGFIQGIIKKCKIDVDDVNRYVLIGGSCKHPVIIKMIKNCVEREPYIVPNMGTLLAEGAVLAVAFLPHDTFWSSPSEEQTEYEKEYINYMNFVNNDFENIEKNCSLLLTSLNKLKIHPDYELADYRSQQSTDNVLELYARPLNIKSPTDADLIRWEKSNRPWTIHDNPDLMEITMCQDDGEEGTFCLLPRYMPPFIEPLDVIQLDYDDVSIWQAFLLFMTNSFAGFRWHGGYYAKKIIFRLNDIKMEESFDFFHLLESIKDESELQPFVEMQDNYKGSISCCFWSNWGGLYKAKFPFEYNEVYKKVKFGKGFFDEIYKYSCGIVY